MSRGNVEIVRRAYDAWNAGDYTAFFAGMDDEIEFVLPEGGMNDGTYRGRREVRQFLESYVESFENFRVTPEELFEAGDKVVAFVRQSGRGRASGIETEARPAHVMTFRGGKVSRLEVFPDREKQAVLEAVGLRA
jgi:ketosteroid isomerase-like protein